MCLSQDCYVIFVVLCFLTGAVYSDKTNGSGNSGDKGSSGSPTADHGNSGAAAAVAARTPDPVQILESFHRTQVETTTNGYKTKCERYIAVCCAKLVEDMTLRRGPDREDLCNDRVYEECKCPTASEHTDAEVPLSQPVAAS